MSRTDAVTEIVDPRGLAVGKPFSPASRIAKLDGQRILLIDNGKLARAYGAYAALWDVLQKWRPTVNWVFFSDDFLQLWGEATFDRLAQDLIAQHQPNAAIIAFADAGVSLQTTLMSLVLEQHGAPTVVLGNLVGARMVRGIYEMRAPGLEPVALVTARTDSIEQIEKVATNALGEIERRLTTEVKPRLRDAPPWDPPVAASAESWSQIADSMQAFQDWVEAQGLSDGLPLLPPTARAIDTLLASVKDDPDEVIFGSALTSGRVMRVRDAAANAVMTACPARSFPVVIAALRAMAKPPYRLEQAATTTHPAGNAIVFSGPDPAKYGMSGGPGCLGPGHRGNATVGRAVALTVYNVLGARAGATDLTILGSTAEFTYCFAEAVDRSPWPSLADEIAGGEPCVFVMKAEAPRNVMDHFATTPRAICEAFVAGATSASSNSAVLPKDHLVIINPEHAKILGDSGWSRRDLAEAIHQLARIPREKIEGRGQAPIRPSYMDSLDAYPVTRSVDDVHIVVAGESGPSSAIAIPWGMCEAQWNHV